MYPSALGRPPEKGVAGPGAEGPRARGGRVDILGWAAVCYGFMVLQTQRKVFINPWQNRSKSSKVILNPSTSWHWFNGLINHLQLIEKQHKVLAKLNELARV